MASENGHVEVVNILLQNGAHVDVPRKVSQILSHNICKAVKPKAMYVSQQHIFGQDKWTPLMIAVKLYLLHRNK